MPLARCPECKKEISDKASFCPHCGCPTGKVPTKIETAISGKLAISTTSRWWKSVKLTSALGIIFGVVLFLVGKPAENERLSQFGLGMIMGGFVGFIVGKIGAWMSDDMAR